MTDTTMALGTRSPRLSRGSRPTLVVGLAFALLGAPAGGSTAGPTPLDAQVVWLRGAHAYLASSDSLALPPTSLLTFMLEARAIATGEVERIVDGGMAVARVTSGSLAGLRDFRRLRILAEPPGNPPLLRVGCPSGKRAHLLFACESVAVVPPPAPSAYRLDGEAPSLRLIRSRGDAGHPRWPDTLLVRTFDDPADEEIALERGELDVALFWPGELSTHLRENPRGRSRLSWPLERGLLGIPESGSTESRCAAARGAASAFQTLGRSLFRGDLDVTGGAAASCGDTTGRAAVRYVVDPSCPGRVTLERLLNRDAPRGAAASDVPVVRVSCLDRRTFSSDDVVIAAAQCQLVFPSRLLPYMRELGPGAWFTLLDCVPQERRP